MTQPISSPARHLLAAALFFAVGILLSASASAYECVCPPGATQSLWGELKQNTCSNLESNLSANLHSWANGQCSGQCGACFYSYTTHYPSCTVAPDGFYTQAATLTYACGFLGGPPCIECGE